MRATVAAMAYLATLAAGNATASAQQAHSTEWRTKPGNDRFRSDDKRDAQREMAFYARCVVNFRYDRARAFVLENYASPQQAKLVGKIVMAGEDSCMSRRDSEARMRFTSEVLAGVVAQALVLRDYPDLPIVVARYTPLPTDEVARVAQLNAAEVFGRCVVQRDPASAMALFVADAGTPAEDRAMGALNEDLGPCLAAGSTLRANRMFIRAVMGVAAYRLAQQVEPREHGRQAVVRKQ